MKKIKLENKYKVRFNDFTNYEAETGCNGGNYGFWITYYRKPGTEEWEVEHGTTADFPFCPICGQFGEHPDCTEYETVTTEEVEKEIENFEETETEYIEIR